MTEVPLIATPNQELAIELEEQDCTIQVRQLGNYTYLTLWVDSTLIVENAICMPGVAILQGYVHGFRGNFVLVDSSDPNNQQLSNYTELGSRFILLYLTDEEINEYS
jgi:hypothetical protein|nr:MAG TPA: hypothetical protein [Bacteriophage sp.]